MNDQLALEPLPDIARLACGHRAPINAQHHPRTREGWYAAVRCPECGRAVGVRIVAYGTLEAAGGDRSDEADSESERGSPAEAAGPTHPPSGAVD